MNRSPLILAIVLLLLPVLYAGSYLALVVPGASPANNYRFGGRWSAQLFWPLEQIDQSVRPNAWLGPSIEELRGLDRP